VSKCNSVTVQNFSIVFPLVGGIPTPLKNISQLGLLLPIYGKTKFMFQTTNQKILGTDGETLGTSPKSWENMGLSIKNGPNHQRFSITFSDISHPSGTGWRCAVAR
jgi:hypothetical protein